MQWKMRNIRSSRYDTKNKRNSWNNHTIHIFIHSMSITYISVALSKLSTIQIGSKHTDNHDITRSFVIKGTGDSHLVYKKNVRDIRGHLTRRGSIMHAGSLSLDGATPTAASLLTNFPCNTLFEWRKTPGKISGESFRKALKQARCASAVHYARGAVMEAHTHTARNFVIKVGMN